MKNLQSIEEGKWLELVSGELTEAQKKLLVSTNPADKKAKEDLVAELKARKPKAATKADATKAQAKYEEVKPILEAGETYEFIAINIMLDGNSLSGILNCRVNEEHKQIRF
jgi:hypothetical protein